jgi:hypothetical protein
MQVSCKYLFLSNYSFLPAIQAFKQCLDSNFGELQGRCWTLAKRWLYNFWRHLKWCPWKLDKEFMILYNCLLGNVITFSLQFTKIGVLTPLECVLNIVNRQKWGETPYQNLSFWGTLIKEGENYISRMYFLAGMQPSSGISLQTGYLPSL